MVLVAVPWTVGRVCNVWRCRLGTEGYVSLSAGVGKMVGVGVVPVLPPRRPCISEYCRRGSGGHM